AAAAAVRAATAFPVDATSPDVTARAAAFAAARAAAADATDGAASAADAVVFAADAATADAAANAAATWLEVEVDIATTSEFGVGRLVDAPIWSSGAPLWASDAWVDCQAALPKGADWEVWTEWYEQRLRGGSRSDHMSSFSLARRTRNGTRGRRPRTHGFV